MLKFYNGLDVITIAEVPGDNKNVIVRAIKNLSLTSDILPADMLVRKDVLETRIQDMFNIGDHVYNRQGSMVGRITAFEFHTNRAVVVSDKIDRYEQKRTRYVYGIKELALYEDDKIRLVPGCWYLINNKHELFAVQSVFNNNDVMLFDARGEIIYRGLPKTTNKHYLNVKHSITSIDEIKASVINL